MSDERYNIENKLGEGGMSSVYAAYDNQLNRKVAIKRLLQSTDADQGDATSLLEEARTLSAFQHPNIVTVYDVGQDDKGVFVVMELLEGETMEQYIARAGVLTVTDFHEFVTQTMEALIAAGKAGLVHRDLKPGNLMISWLPSGKFHIKILDFGLAKFHEMTSVQDMDRQDEIYGSLYFMAPEQFERLETDSRTDLYAMGCVFYNILTDQYPFSGDSPEQVMNAHLHHSVEHIAHLRPDLPKTTASWVMWLISRLPDTRPEDAAVAYKHYLAKTIGTNAPEGVRISGKIALAGDSTMQRAGITSDEEEKTRQKNKLWIMLAVIALLLIIGAFIFYKATAGHREMTKMNEIAKTGQTVRGTPDTVTKLIPLLAGDDTTKINDATGILNKLQGSGIDAAIYSAFTDKNTPARAKKNLIPIIGNRKITTALPDFISIIAARKPKYQLQPVIENIGKITEPTSLTNLVSLLGESKDKTTITDVSGVITEVLTNTPAGSDRIRAINAVVNSVPPLALDRFMTLVGALGDDQTLPIINNLIEDSNEAKKIAAIHALGAWPNSSDNNLLLSIAADQKNNSATRKEAMTAYLQSTTNQFPDPKNADPEPYRKAFEIAGDNAALGKIVLHAIAKLRATWSYDFLAPIAADVDHPVSNEAAKLMRSLGK